MARIRCAHCKDTHTSVAAVRQCAWEEQEAAWEAANDPDAAYERFLESDPRYAWECEQDELRAAAFGLPL
jgi:hypothetical protein